MFNNITEVHTITIIISIKTWITHVLWALLKEKSTDFFRKSLKACLLLGIMQNIGYVRSCQYKTSEVT